MLELIFTFSVTHLNVMHMLVGGEIQKVAFTLF
jgi:hypothetical protein